MNLLARKFFQEEANFSETRVLSDDVAVSWEEVAVLDAGLPRGWFELSRLPRADRIEFTADFWLSRFTFDPAAHPGLIDFFGDLDDVAVIVHKEKGQEVWRSELVYSLNGSSSFFRGLPPASEEEWADLGQELRTLLPRDYSAFLRIHNGFGKLSELGILSIEGVMAARRRVMHLLLEIDPPLQCGGKWVDAGALIPFFEQEGFSSFQCFYADWYPGSEMGNVHLSGADGTISSPSAEKGGGEGLSFHSFLEWLEHYLQGMSVSL